MLVEGGRNRNPVVGKDSGSRTLVGEGYKYSSVGAMALKGGALNREALAGLCRQVHVGPIYVSFSEGRG